ncbi:MAG TPA: hypothetical protein VFU23_01250 [Gemmatimonadales bacterium]|nr:hypothetical protein [Gemmatimonadales bacterium]
MRPGIVVGIGLAALACRYRPQPVPVWGERADVAKLAGEWEGEYSSTESRRTGSITFMITAQGDSAFGDVLMPVPAGEEALRPIDPAQAHLTHARSADLLSVQFVTITGGRLRGELEPYIAPDCECVVRTVFTGTVTGNTIAGTYLTTTPWGGRQEGRWRVARVSP